MSHRNITHRPIPGTKAKARQLSSAAGACRFVWNYCLGENKKAMETYWSGAGEKPSVSFLWLGKQFTELRQNGSKNCHTRPNWGGWRRERSATGV